MRIEPAVPEAALAAIRAPLLSPAPSRIEPSLTLPLGLMLDLAGEATRARLFIVQAEGGAESCLRPDFTVAIVQDHLARRAGSALYGYEGRAFQAAPASEEPEEFVQLGLERLSAGERNAAADDVEIVAAAWRAANAGGRLDLTLRLGDVALFAAFLGALKAPEAVAARLVRLAGRPRLLQAELARAGDGRAAGGVLTELLSGLSEDRAGALLEEVWSLAGVEPVGGRSAGEIAARLVRKAEAAGAPALSAEQAAAVRAFLGLDADPAAAFARIRSLAGRGADDLESALAGWEDRLAQLSSTVAEDRLRFTPALGHAFEYYDGLTFEVVSGVLGPSRPVAAGGRYDGLMVRLGGGPGLSAVGCMVRPWRAWMEGGR